MSDGEELWVKMRKFIKSALLVINIASLAIGLVAVLFYLYCEFFGYIKGNSLLKSIYSPLNSNVVSVVEYVCAATMMISYLERKKLP